MMLMQPGKQQGRVPKTQKIQKLRGNFFCYFSRKQTIMAKQDQMPVKSGYLVFSMLGHIHFKQAYSSSPLSVQGVIFSLPQTADLFQLIRPWFVHPTFIKLLNFR